MKIVNKKTIWSLAITVILLLSSLIAVSAIFIPKSIHKPIVSNNADNQEVKYVSKDFALSDGEQRIRAYLVDKNNFWKDTEEDKEIFLKSYEDQGFSSIAESNWKRIIDNGERAKVEYFIEEKNKWYIGQVTSKGVNLIFSLRSTNEPEVFYITFKGKDGYTLFRLPEDKIFYYRIKN